MVGEAKGLAVECAGDVKDDVAGGESAVVGVNADLADGHPFAVEVCGVVCHCGYASLAGLI